MAMRGGASRVAVIVPSYNRRATLDRCLSSLEAQTFLSIEVVVVDDGSTDGTAEFLATRLARTSLNLRYIWQENAGCAAARNTGLRASTAELFVFLDSDDAMEPEAVASLVATLDRAGADFAYSPAIEVYPNGKCSLNRPVAAGDPAGFAVEHFLDPNVRNGAVLFCRHLLERVGYVDETMRYNEDSDFVQRYSLYGKPAYSDVPTVRHYHHAGNKSANRVRIYQALLESCERLLAMHPAFRQQLGRRADKRLEEIRRYLIESMILLGDYGGAKAVAMTSGHLPFAHRLSLAWQRGEPILLELTIRRALSRLTRWVR